MMQEKDKQPEQQIYLRMICENFDKHFLDSGVSSGSIIDVANTKRSDNSVAIINSKEIQLLIFTDTHEHLMKIGHIAGLGWTEDSFKKIICPNERRIVVATANKAAIFDLDVNTKKYSLTSFTIFDSPFVSIACSAAKNLFLCALEDGNIVLWNFESPNDNKISLKLYDKLGNRWECIGKSTSVRFISDSEFICTVADHSKIHKIQLINESLQIVWYYHDEGPLRLLQPYAIAIMPDCIVAPTQNGKSERSKLVTLDLRDGRVTKSMEFNKEITAITQYSKTELIATNTTNGLSKIDLEKQAITWSYCASKFVGHYRQTQINLLSSKWVLTTDAAVANIWEIGNNKQPQQISHSKQGKQNQHKLFLALSGGKVFMLDDGIFIGTVNELAKEFQKYIELKRLAAQENYPQEIISHIAHYAFFSTSNRKPDSIPHEQDNQNNSALIQAPFFSDFPGY